MKQITVLLAEDHTIVRQGVRQVLELQRDIEVVGEAQDGGQVVALVKKLHPAVVLMDIAMPHINGLKATRQVLKAVPDTKVVILSAHNDDEYVKTATESGAVGFLLKQSCSQDVCRAIREVSLGKPFFSPSIARHLKHLHPQTFDRSGACDTKCDPLTPREMEVLKLVAEGNANKEIAVELGISFKTVEKHRDHLMKKLDIHDTAGLTRYAVSAGIIASTDN